MMTLMKKTIEKLGALCVQLVQLVLDRCGGVAVKELEGTGGGALKMDESGCRAAGETPGNQRYDNKTRIMSPHAFQLINVMPFSPAKL